MASIIAYVLFVLVSLLMSLQLILHHHQRVKSDEGVSFSIWVLVNIFQTSISYPPGMEKLECIIHYDIKDAKYSKLKQISDINKDRISNAKILREREGGFRYHKQQCKSIPEEIDDSKHGIHLEPCYKKFTFILSQLNLKDNEQPSTSTSRPKRLPFDQVCSRNIYPKECQFCKKYRVKRKGKEYLPITITTKNAVENMKMAAESKGGDLYYEIRYLDLIAKEFRYHIFCYKDFIRHQKSSNNNEQEESDTQKGNFEAVIEFIEKTILFQNQAVSMSLIHEIFGVHSQDRRYRNKIKIRIQDLFPEKLLFLSIGKNEPEVVIRKDGINSHTVLNSPERIVKEAAELLRSNIIEYAQNTPQ